MGKIFLCLLVLSLVSCDFAQDMLYPLKEANEVAVPDSPPEGYFQELLEVKHSDGNILVHFWYFEQSKADAPVILFFHGQKENIGNPRIAELLKNFEETKANFVLIDYPGYGKSTGKASQSTILAGADIVLSWVQNHFKNSKIYIFGWSLGAAVAAQVVSAHQNDLEGFVLASGWTKLEDIIAKYGAPAPPGEWFNANKWDSLDAAAKTKLRGIVIHGDQDKIIPFEFGKKLAETYSQIEFIPISGADHDATIKSEQLWTSVKMLIGN